MLRMLPPGGLKTPPPDAPPQGPPAGGPPPELLAALAAQGGGDAPPPDAPDEGAPHKGIKYSIDKVSQDVARYLAPGSTCGTCHFFDGKSGCHVVSGSIDPAATCSLWSGDNGLDQGDPTSQETDDVQGPPDEPAGPDPTQ